MNVRVLQEAEVEAFEAALWCEGRRAGLGDDFYDEFQRVLTVIQEDPQRLPLLEDYTGRFEVRRIRLHRFCYAAIVQCRPDGPVVVAISHLHRRPLYWLDRLG